MEQKSVGQVKWNTEVVTKKNVGPKYSRFSESLRHVTPSTLQCSMFCGGKQCKYENPSKVKDGETVIKGLYSAWYVFLRIIFCVFVQWSIPLCKYKLSFDWDYRL